MVRRYNHEGLSVQRCMNLVGITANQYYHKSSGRSVGRRPSQVTKHICPHTQQESEVDNSEVVKKVVQIKLDPDQANYYRLITDTLKLQGYYINHKKVYRLMKEYILLEDRRKVSGKKYVQYRRAIPDQPLHILEMDIKYAYIHDKRRYAYVLTVIDTYTRYVLHWDVGYSMQSVQVQQVWEYILAEYIQPIRGKSSEVHIEVRSDNGKQFSSKVIMDFFKDNYLDKVFTHPYTPEENGHIESFHHKLGKALKNDRFESLEGLQTRLVSFYQRYNNDRPHGSLRGLPPAIFWALDTMGHIEIVKDEKRKKTTVQLNVVYQEILGLQGIHKYRYRALRA